MRPTTEMQTLITTLAAQYDFDLTTTVLHLPIVKVMNAGGMGYFVVVITGDELHVLHKELLTRTGARTLAAQAELQIALATAAKAGKNNRAWRAMQLVLVGAVSRNGAGHYVRNQSRSKRYHVQGDKCTCPDYLYRGRTCKHITAVHMWERMSEQDLMEATFNALRTGEIQPAVAFSDAELEAMEEEQIGADFGRHPYRY